ncbi:uncharacterized protein LOC141843443 [Curcuma longa]|uniref:uncharacterized protein LOC141843443 n=1 Tax=Curcuma longa TaxID=136217 RepID=UPI003D9F5AB8
MAFTRGASEPESDSNSASSYTSSEEKAERDEKKVHLVSSAPKHPPRPPVSSKDDEREEDSEDDGSSDEEFDESEMEEPEVKRQSHYMSDHDSSHETPLSARNPLPPVPSNADRDKDDDENVDSEEDESSGESDDGETTGILPSSDSTMHVDASPETVKKRVADSSENNQSRKHTSFGRLWSLDDEIALLKGLVEYHSENGSVPSSASDMDGVRHLIKSSIRLEVSDKQLADKVRRLKQNFLTSYACSKNKVSLNFSDPHEQNLYELSKKLWGVKTITLTEEIVSSDSDDAKESEQKSKEENLNSHDTSTHSEVSLRSINGNLCYPLLWETVNKLADGHSCGVAIRKAFEMVDDAKANVIENKLKKLRENEIKHHLSGVNLNQEMVKLILDSAARTK